MRLIITFDIHQQYTEVQNIVCSEVVEMFHWKIYNYKIFYFICINT